MARRLGSGKRCVPLGWKARAGVRVGRCTPRSQGSYCCFRITVPDTLAAPDLKDCLKKKGLFVGPNSVADDIKKFVKRGYVSAAAGSDGEPEVDFQYDNTLEYQDFIEVLQSIGG